MSGVGGGIFRAMGLGAAVGLMAASLMAGGALAAETTVIQKSIAFQPKEITIKPGDTVAFVNQDAFGHNVYSESAGGAFDIGLQQPNQRTTVPFRRDGTFEAQCRIHPKMKLKIVVQN